MWGGEEYRGSWGGMESDESLREAAFRLAYLWSGIFINECVTPDERGRMVTKKQTGESSKVLQTDGR